MSDDFDLLVLDLDGTTLDADGKLGQRDIDAAQALTEAGVRITIATGRLYTGSRWVADRLGVQGSIALMNGSQLVDVQTDAVTHANYLDREVRRHARDVLADHGLSAFLFRTNQVHLDHRDQHHNDYMATWTEDLEHHLDLFLAEEWHAADDVLAVGAAGDQAVVERARERIHTELPPELDSVTFHTYHGHFFMKLRHSVDDKGTALERLAAERGTTAERTVAVGDWMNDLPMLRRAGRSFAMGGSAPSVVEAADGVLDAPRAGGGAIAEVAERVWGVKL